MGSAGMSLQIEQHHLQTHTPQMMIIIIITTKIVIIIITTIIIIIIITTIIITTKIIIIITSPQSVIKKISGSSGQSTETGSRSGSGHPSSSQILYTKHNTNTIHNTQYKYHTQYWPSQLISPHLYKVALVTQKQEIHQDRKRNKKGQFQK